MDVFTFITAEQLHKPVILFHGHTYPLLFFRWFLHRPSQQLVRMLSVNDLDMQEVQKEIEVSFLGQSCCYWLGNISELAVKYKQQLLTLLRGYQGPNTVIAWCQSEDVVQIPSTIQLVVCADEVTESEFIKLACMIEHIELDHAVYVARYLYERHKTIAFEQVLSILPYLRVLSAKQITQFIQEWGHHFIISQTSLFNLSRYFFEKNARIFFEEWKYTMPQYSQQFWIIFWSDQLWRAAWYITLARAKQRYEAKKISYKLPFTFLQDQWRHYSVRELKAAHDFMYGIDYATKNGNGTVGLELFFSQFFENRF